MRSVTILVAALVSAALAGCVTNPDDLNPADTLFGGSADVAGPFAVVALIDNGINPYHAAFRDDSPRAYAHPSTYLAGYPEDAKALHVTFNHEELEDAILADCAIWESVEPDTLYWFPGTRIVGAISPSVEEDFVMRQADRFSCGDAEGGDTPQLVYAGSHGTMTASRAAGSDYGACPECLIVMVEGFGGKHVTWAAEQPWIDLQSNSWGPIAPGFLPTGTGLGLVGSDSEFVRTVEAAAAKQPSFWASGNGALFRLGVLGHPTQAAWHMTPSVIRVGGHDSGRVALWPGSAPHVVSDACWSWAAEHDSMDESTARTGGGTSGATPFVAGLAGKVVLEARRAVGDERTGVRDGVLAEGTPVGAAGSALEDGKLTVEELRAALFRTADSRPDRLEQDGDVCDPAENPFNALYPGLPVEWQQVPDGPQAVYFVGYGAVTPDTAAVAVDVLLGNVEMPDRAAEDAWFAADNQYRESAYPVLSGLP